MATVYNGLRFSIICKKVVLRGGGRPEAEPKLALGREDAAFSDPLALQQIIDAHRGT
jgi:hypothetical protein